MTWSLCQFSHHWSMACVLAMFLAYALQQRASPAAVSWFCCLADAPDLPVQASSFGAASFGCVTSVLMAACSSTGDIHLQERLERFLSVFRWWCHSFAGEDWLGLSETFALAHVLDAPLEGCMSVMVLRFTLHWHAPSVSSAKVPLGQLLPLADFRLGNTSADDGAARLCLSFLLELACRSCRESPKQSRGRFRPWLSLSPSQICGLLNGCFGVRGGNPWRKILLPKTNHSGKVSGVLGEWWGVPVVLEESCWESWWVPGSPTEHNNPKILGHELHFFFSGHLGKPPSGKVVFSDRCVSNLWQSQLCDLIFVRGTGKFPDTPVIYQRASQPMALSPAQFRVVCGRHLTVWRAGWSTIHRRRSANSSSSMGLAEGWLCSWRKLVASSCVCSWERLFPWIVCCSRCVLDTPRNSLSHAKSCVLVSLQSALHMTALQVVHLCVWSRTWSPVGDLSPPGASVHGSIVERSARRVRCVVLLLACCAKSAMDGLLSRDGCHSSILTSWSPKMLSISRRCCLVMVRIMRLLPLPPSWCS